MPKSTAPLSKATIDGIWKQYEEYKNITKKDPAGLKVEDFRDIIQFLYGLLQHVDYQMEVIIEQVNVINEVVDAAKQLGISARSLKEGKSKLKRKADGGSDDEKVSVKRIKVETNTRKRSGTEEIEEEGPRAKRVKADTHTPKIKARINIEERPKDDRNTFKWKTIVTEGQEEMGDRRNRFGV